MKKKLSLIFTLALATLMTTGCDFLDNVMNIVQPSNKKEEGTQENNQQNLEEDQNTNTEENNEQNTDGTDGGSTQTTVVDPVNTEDVDAYYSGVSDSLSGAALKTKLHELIKITKSGWEYSNLFDAYRKTDVRPDGETFWDIYSDKSNYTLNDKRINSSYKKEGDSINKEHIIPQSYFNEASPMKADVHHVLPSDGYVNNRRSAYPHGEVTGSITYTSEDGYILGSGTGNGTVFEPKDHYKGDIARIYFYFVTCYQDRLSSFKNFTPIVNNTYPSFNTTFLELYLEWSVNDPVSDKETIRNNAAYEGQHNRNPFVDRPSYACKIWGATNTKTKQICGVH